VLQCATRDHSESFPTKFLLHLRSHPILLQVHTPLFLCNTPRATSTIPSGTCSLTRSFICEVGQGVPNWFDERCFHVDNRQDLHMSPLTRSKVRLPRWGARVALAGGFRSVGVSTSWKVSQFGNWSMFACFGNRAISSRFVLLIFALKCWVKAFAFWCSSPAFEGFG